MFHRLERLLLRPWWADDAEALLAGIGHWNVVRNLATAPWPYGLADARRFVAAKSAPDPMHPSFAVTLPGVGLVGGAGIGPEPETGGTEIGYCIAADHRGRGYAGEVARALVEIAAMLGHRRLEASHFVDNPVSGRVLERAGFRATGVTRPGHSLARGGYDPVRCYAIALATRETLASAA